MRDFFRMPNAVIDSDLNAFAISVYAVLARHVGRNETCWPSLSRIQKLTKLSRGTVIRAIDDLRLAGMIEIAKGAGTVNRYVLTSSPGAPVDDGTSSPGEPTSSPGALTGSPGAPVPVHLVNPNKTHERRLIKKTHEEEGASAFVLPDWVPVESWTGFAEMRRTIHKPMTARGQKLIVQKLSGFKASGYNIAEILDNSTMSNWAGVFEPRQNGGMGHGESNARRAERESHEAINKAAANLRRRHGIGEVNGVDAGDGSKADAH